jgi:glucokinase
MTQTIGVLATEHIAAGVVENSRIVGPILVSPKEGEVSDDLGSLHAEEIVQRLAEQVRLVQGEGTVKAIGIGFPGIICDGVVADSPNLRQVKGYNLEEELHGLLGERIASVTVHVLNDADAMAAGIAATRSHLDRVVRVWTLGNGVGFGRYPQGNSISEGGHSVVTLDPKENYCQCGGIGHLEGIVGHRAMRLRFLDLEPEEVFDHARAGDERCSDFVKIWHRALAAATSTSIHMDGPGKFFISGPNARFVQVGLLHMYVHEMVKMSPLQDNTFEKVTTGDEVAIIGAAVSAEHASEQSTK